MDRSIIYAGSLPDVADILFAEQAAMKAIGYCYETVLGLNSAVYGCVAQPTSPASMQVQIGRGVITALMQTEATPYGVLTTDASNLLKAALNPGFVAIPGGSAFAAPAGAGTSIAYLIQAGISETDTTPLALSYYNAANPSAPFTGPGNSGTAQNTRRVQTVNFQIKAGAAATTGSQTTPAVDSGFIPLYVVTIPNGTTAITTAMIAVHPQAPIIPFSLQRLTPGFSRVVTFGVGSASWTVPAGVWQIRGRLWGSGGGGGGCNSAAGCAVGGGGGGYADGIYPVTPGQVIPITVPAGGAPGTSTPTNGSAGGTTSLGSLASAFGGNGGPASTGGVTTGGAQGGGATGATGTFASFTGQSGAPGITGASSAYYGGQGGASPRGGGIGRTSNVGTTSDSGQFPGGGGNGAGGVAIGGQGGNGYLEIWY